MGKSPKKGSKTARLRDPSNPEEQLLSHEVEQLRRRIYNAWLLEGRFATDFSDLAKKARLHPSTVEGFVLETRDSRMSTIVRIAYALGYRVTLMPHDAAVGNREAAPDPVAGKALARARRLYKRHNR